MKFPVFKSTDQVMTFHMDLYAPPSMFTPFGDYFQLRLASKTGGLKFSMATAGGSSFKGNATVNGQ